MPPLLLIGSLRPLGSGTDDEEDPRRTSAAISEAAAARDEPPAAAAMQLALCCLACARGIASKQQVAPRRSQERARAAAPLGRPTRCSQSCCRLTSRRSVRVAPPWRSIVASGTRDFDALQRPGKEGLSRGALADGRRGLAAGPLQQNASSNCRCCLEDRWHGAQASTRAARARKDPSAARQGQCQNCG